MAVKNQFREEVKSLAGKGIEILTKYFKGEDNFDENIIRHASRMISEGVKVDNRDQIDAQVKRSQAIKLIPHIPPEMRQKYIINTNPDTKPFLLDRPGK